MSANPLAPAGALVNTQVNINVAASTRDPGYAYTIDYYPKRRGDTKVFYSATASLASPVKPREVEWLVTGLQPNQQIVLEQKYAVATNGLGKKKYIITPTSPAPFLSGPAQHGTTTPGVEDVWQYSIRLTPLGNDAAGSDLAKMIDPMVIIDNDP